MAELTCAARRATCSRSIRSISDRTHRRRPHSRLSAAQSHATSVSVATNSPVACLDSSALVKLIAIEPETAAPAAQIGGTTLRSLDTIHLATAASISRQLGALITYDQRMISEAQTLAPPRPR